MNSTFREGDVVLLLKDITGQVDPLPTAERERRIQQGTHYSEMLPLEYRPTADYIRIYEKALDLFGQDTADAVARVSDRIVRKKGRNVVIVSLARAGTPLGILIRRYIRKKYGLECPHYSISIIRDRGMDRNAIRYILDRHRAEDIQFVDGWTGKGVIWRELKKEIAAMDGGLDDELAVLADPAGLTALCGTHRDILIPSSCLNCTVCGLISRTFLRHDLIGANDFHGAAFYRELAGEDRTDEFIRRIEGLFRFDLPEETETLPEGGGEEEVWRIAEKYRISNLNYVKPGIGETTRVLLRRVPWKILAARGSEEDPGLEPIRQLAREKQVPVEYTELRHYRCCGLIRQLSDL